MDLELEMEKERAEKKAQRLDSNPRSLELKVIVTTYALSAMLSMVYS